MLGTDMLQDISIPDSKKTWISVVRYTTRIIPLIVFSILQYFISSIGIKLIAIAAILNSLFTFIVPSYLYLKFNSENNIPINIKITHYFSLTVNSLLVFIIIVSLI
jgi:hypothetical protein